MQSDQVAASSAVSGEAEQLRKFLEECLSADLFPSYQALVLERDREIFSGWGGRAVLAPDRAATMDTLYDLASLTKPLVTAALVLQLADEGVMPLEMPVARWLDSMCAAPLDRVTVLDLLTHRGGFEPWVPFYLTTPPVLARYARAASARPLRFEPRTDVVYSDLGYLILGAAIEAATGQPFAVLARRTIGGAAELRDVALPPAPQDRDRCAATELGNDHERKLAGREAGTPGFRSDLIWGTVHDGNAWGLGGVAPHAGLFGTARGVARLAAAMVGRGSAGPAQFSSAARSLTRLDLTPSARSHRTAAFELASGPDTAASGVLPADSFGHTGFTGTSLWFEPKRERLYILLTNRVHPQVGEINMNVVRRRFHLLAAGLGADQAPRSPGGEPLR